MKRGDIVTVAIKGDHGKTDRALVIRSDFLSDTGSELVCLLTLTQRHTPLYRLALPTGEDTGLRQEAQVILDKIMAIRRDGCGAPIGRVDEATLLALGRLLASATGIADWGAEPVSFHFYSEQSHLAWW